MNNQSMTTNSETELDSYDWFSELQKLSYAFEQPEISGKIKVNPEDFVVTELMDIEPSGEGEHIWLDITKTRCNTDAVAKALAKFSGVAYRDVSYSGMKDFHAVTRQWFSIWRPKGEPLSWSDFSLDGVEIHLVTRHARKIKRGTHRANAFRIRVSSLQRLNDQSEASLESVLDARLNKIKQYGVPNYFGAQRFGRNANNMRQAVQALVHGKRFKDRNLRGLILSSARSWLFNCCVSKRVKSQCWYTLFPFEPANLDGSNSVFTSQNSEQDISRLEKLDIHPTAPMWGEGYKEARNQYTQLADFEDTELTPFAPLMHGLEKARLNYQRRAIRTIARNLQWQFDIDEQLGLPSVILSFELFSGQFATSVIRELILDDQG